MQIIRMIAMKLCSVLSVETKLGLQYQAIRFISMTHWTTYGETRPSVGPKYAKNRDMHNNFLDVCLLSVIDLLDF